MQLRKSIIANNTTVTFSDPIQTEHKFWQIALIEIDERRSVEFRLLRFIRMRATKRRETAKRRRYKYCLRHLLPFPSSSLFFFCSLFLSFFSLLSFEIASLRSCSFPFAVSFTFVMRQLLNSFYCGLFLSLSLSLCSSSSFA